GGTLCVSGMCVNSCPSEDGGTLTLCLPDAGAPYCADTTDDPSNCGRCGAACPLGQLCLGGACHVPGSNSIVFVSSATYGGGNLGGLTGADPKCQSLATAAVLPGTYKAWLSDDTTSAASRLTHSTNPYVLVDGKTI